MILQKARQSGFTFIELLVVVSVILILAGLLVHTLVNLNAQKKNLLARKQIGEIYQAAGAYQEQLGAFPPDRQNYGTGTAASPDTVFDPLTISKFLGQPITDAASGKTYGPFLKNPPESLRSDGVMVDPWGFPYEFDAVHIKYLPNGNVLRIGEPYSGVFLSGGNPNMRVDVKIWSAGLDHAWINGSNTGVDKGPATADIDNKTNWAD